jgi:hypothetical protein
MIVCLALLLVTAFITVDAYAAKHGAGAIKSAAPCKEPGQNAENLIEVVYLDEFNDVLQVLEGFDVIKAGGGDVEIHNLPISNKSGNAKCCGSDATPVTPCYIGPAGSTYTVPGSVTGCGDRQLPGAGTPGRVEFISDTYVIEPGDAPVLDDDGKIRWSDLCTAGTSGCSFAEQIATAGASTSVCVQDANLCDTESCQDTNDDQIPDACLGTPITCNDDNECTTDTCNDATGCVYTPIVCNDSNACTADACDPATGCTHSAISCDDSNACTADACDPATGCTHSAISCNDSNACTADACDPATGCTHSAISCNDSNACTTDTCVPATGCVYTPDVVCNDGNACTTDACVPATGCVYTADVVCNDNSVCTTDTCDPATGCVYTDITCDDGDICTDDTCDPSTGCVYTPDPTNDPSCSKEAICRTPGFWKTHAGTEKNGSMNVTQAVINACGGCLDVCGTAITNTDKLSFNSALEAMCDYPNQPIFHLTAMALNCCISGFGSDCSGGDPYLSQLFADANSSCESGGSYRKGEVDDWNNGLSGNNCHDRELCNEEFGVCFMGGPAGSPKACQAASNNKCTVFGAKNGGICSGTLGDSCED